MKILWSIAGVCLGLGLVCSPPLGAGPDEVAEPPIQQNVERLLKAVIDKDLASFVLDSTPEFRTIPQSTMDYCYEHYGAHFEKGYDLAFLAELNRHHERIFLWKLHPKDGSDDQLVSLVMDGALVSGFHFH